MTILPFSATDEERRRIDNDEKEKIDKRRKRSIDKQQKRYILLFRHQTKKQEV